MLRRLPLFTIACVTVVLATSTTASAHNSLVSSDPADGATLATAPTQLMFVFDKPVPLDTLSVELIDSSGVRTDLTGSAHGPTGDTEVVTTRQSTIASRVDRDTDRGEQPAARNGH